MKKLKISKNQQQKLEMLRTKLQDVLVENDEELVYGGYCFEQCKTTCAYYCEALCSNSCMGIKAGMAMCATITGF